MATQKRFIAKNGVDNNNQTLTNVADPVNAQDVSTKAFSSNASNLASGTVAAARMPALSGDVTTTAGSTSTTLANSGVTAGTYTKLTVDAKGRATSGTSLVSADLPTYTGTITSSQITTGLGYTPYNSTNPNGYITSSGSITGNATTATTSTYSLVQDTRAGQLLPNGYGSNRTTYEFTNQISGISGWKSAITTMGWNGAYSAWQIIGPSDTTADENFYLRSGVSSTWNTARAILHSGNYNSYSPTLTGTGASGTWGINVTGNAATATNLSTTRANWSSNGTISAVVGQLAWKNYNNDHTIFDASAGTSPDGTAVNNTNAATAWSATYPTLMGWNGSSTYGVRVDSARVADSATSATNSTNATYLSATQQTNVITGKQSSLSISQNNTTENGSFVARATGTGDANLAGMTFHNDSYALKMGVRADGYIGIGGWSRAAWSWYSDPNGNMVAAGNVTAYSDPRLKENFKRVDNPMEILNRLDGGTFVWKSGYKHIENKAGKRDYGILADQVEAVMPEIVTNSIELDGETFKTVSYDKLIPVLIEAIKELSAKVTALEAK